MQVRPGDIVMADFNLPNPAIAAAVVFLIPLCLMALAAAALYALSVITGSGYIKGCTDHFNGLMLT